MEQRTPSSPPPLVWVTQGKSQHAAHQLDSKDTMCLVRWTSTNKTDWVHQNDVDKHLTCRRRCRPEELAIRHRRENPESESNIQSSASGRRKTAALVLHQDESEDDEVEVLLTILPPTPKRRKQIGEADAGARVDEARRVSTSPMSESPCSDEGIRLEEGKSPADVMKSSAAQQSAKTDKAPPASAIPSAKTDSFQEEKPQYAFQSSAYVQNLAEICYTILYDRRWRVEGKARKRLFAWEKGEDLSAVHLLSKLFTPPTKRPFAKCTCLLCREETKGCVETPGKPSATELDQSVLTQDTTLDLAKSSSRENPRCKIDDEVARAISLYCRLYYRKGPWFRLDDIYTRYYAPKKHFTMSESKENAAESGASAEREGTALKESRHGFFKHSSSSQLKTVGDRQTSGVKKDEMIDQAAIQIHISALVLLLNDIDHLNEIGLLRSFHNEEECGKTVGAVTLDGSGVILRAEERRAVVTKLGGGSKLDKNRRAASSNGASGRQRFTSATENVIWKQMWQQRSISLGVPNDANKSKVLLPVCRHVNDMLFDKLATSIVLASSRANYVPAPVLRSAVSDFKTKLCGLLKSSSRSLCMCVTLREAPLLTLRRCGRLYMCATSGPGDMRSDGSNSWRSLKDVDAALIHPDVPFLNAVQPPGAYSWHRVVHPGLSHRFGITSCAFIDAHDFLGCDDDPCEIEDKDSARSYNILNIEHADQLTSRAVHEQIFESVDAFRLWEASVELRAHVDYYLELNDTILYQARRRARENNEKDNTKGVNTRERQTDSIDVDDALTSESRLASDFLELLSVDGRKSAIYKVLALSCATSQEHNILASKMIERLHQEVEHTITKLEAFIRDESIRALESDSSVASGLFTTDSQKIIVVLSTIILHVLIDRNLSITADELMAKKSRPWLRHLYWEGILAYALWDCIPVLERLKFFDLACSCLEVILYGKVQARETMDLFEPGAQANGDRFWSLPELFVSRRTRGKAHERLVIDYVHLLRWKLKTDSTSTTNEIDPTAGEALKVNGEKHGCAVESEATPQDFVRRSISEVVRTAACTALIPFSAVRSLARRLKVPLAESLQDLRCEEVNLLGLRLNTANDTAVVDTQSQKPKAYIDWSPPTDNAVANAIAGEGSLLGQRCSYVGFEDNASIGADTSSLNVEELAMEYYASGRLPVTENEVDVLAGGGWTGWHNEGGHVRALFRIICARPILGIDSGCGGECSCPLEALERLTIHLTPYQGAPFDLHVAHWEPSVSRSGGADTKASVRSFYQRRRIQIDRFLTKLEGLSGQALCDLVYDSIVARLDSFGHGRVHDALLARDLQQIRTMSMLAAGFGGKQLSAMFRCLLFDYRHYSGGLPDLLLVRARYKTPDSVAESEKPQSLVDLGAWVGEGFSTESKMEQEVASRTNLLIDKDDEFLGCSKIGDSGAQSSGRWQRGAQRQPSGDNALNELCIDKVPPKLVLLHDDRNVQVQCMFVEVKSLNDRLDGRQEDWLNVLDRIGNARVCKFGNRKKASKKTAVAK